MSEESELLKKLVESVADGDPIDWQALDELALDDHLRRLVAHLRLVSEVADVHRSRVDDVGDTPGDLRTRPDLAPPPPPRQPPPQPPGVTPPGEPPSPESPQQERWGHLLLVRKIGEGAFGEVFLAHDPWLDHSVALKLLKKDVAATLPTKILHEARKLARVRHANVVTVHGADKHNGRIGFWMDFIEGQTLADWLGEGRLSAGEAAHIGQEVCRALSEVHQANIVHRDVKAQNVMRASRDGRIILMDFGAGEFLDNPLLSLNEGTPLYLAPEVLEGGLASIQSDVYAVGVLLYHLVTRGYPVTGASVRQLREAHRKGLRRHLSDERADMPDGFIAAVERALDPDPARRFTSAGQMYAALAGQPPTSPIVTEGLEHTASPAPSRWRILAAGALVFLAAVFVTGFVASRVFEVALHIDPEFAAGPIDYLIVGTQAVPPVILHWISAAALCFALLGIRFLLLKLLKGLASRWSSALPRLDAGLVAGGTLALGAASWAFITWTFYGIFAALFTLQEASPNQSLDFTILSPSSHGFHTAHTLYSDSLSFLLGLAAWRLFPHLEREVSDPRTVRQLKWATLLVAFLAVVAAAAPRRVIWERFDVVMFENQPSLVIGSSDRELLLYAPQRDIARQQRVAQGAETLRYTGIRRKLFEDGPPPD
jgi:serine/threonine-protein kinase